MSYRWKNLSFALPDGLIDETVLTFVDNDEAPRVTVTVATEDTDDVDAYVAEVKDELKEIVAGIKVRASGQEDVGGAKATRLDIDIPTEDGPRRQTQLYVPVAGGVVVMTATSAIPDALKAEAALRSITASFTTE